MGLGGPAKYNVPANVLGMYYDNKQTTTVARSASASEPRFDSRKVPQRRALLCALAIMAHQNRRIACCLPAPITSVDRDSADGSLTCWGNVCFVVGPIVLQSNAEWDPARVAVLVLARLS